MFPNEILKPYCPMPAKLFEMTGSNHLAERLKEKRTASCDLIALFSVSLAEVTYQPASASENFKSKERPYTSMPVFELLPSNPEKD